MNKHIFNKNVGEFIITHIYFKDGKIKYKLKTYISQFLHMSYELSGKAIPIDRCLVEEEYINLIKESDINN